MLAKQLHNAGFLAALIFATATAVVSESALAAEVTDQTNVIPNSASPVLSPIFATETRAQTFTVGAPGRLMRIDVQIYRRASTTDALLIELRRVNAAGQPDELQPLAAISLPATWLPQVPAFPAPATPYAWHVTTSTVAVHVGDRLAIVASSSASTSSNGYVWLARNTDVFASGEGMLRTTGPSFVTVAGDQGFGTSVEQAIRFVWRGVVTAFYPFDSGGSDFAVGDVIVGKYSFPATLSSFPGATPDIDAQYSGPGTQWSVEVPSRGYVLTGNSVQMATANDNPVPFVHDRYLAGFFGLQSSTSFPSGRAVELAQLDLKDNTTGHLLSSSLLPLIAPNPADADQPDGRIVFTNNDHVFFQVTSLRDPCTDSIPNDSDLDGICDDIDNCPGITNPDQLNSDPDGLGDACDPDRDNDGVANADDNCPLTANPLQSDTFGYPGVGDACDLGTFGSSTENGQQSVANNPPQYRWRFDASSTFSSSSLPASVSPSGQCVVLEITPTEITTDFVNYAPNGFTCCSWEMQCLAAPPCIAPSGQHSRVLPNGHAIGSASFGYGTRESEPETFQPADLDTLPDQCDNCDFVDNEDQLDSNHNGIGNACECGDIDDNGLVQASDAQALRLALAKLTTLPVAKARKCNVYGSTNAADSDGNGLRDDCNIVDVAVLRRATGGRLPPVGVSCPALSGAN